MLRGMVFATASASSRAGAFSTLMTCPRSPCVVPRMLMSIECTRDGATSARSTVVSVGRLCGIRPGSNAASAQRGTPVRRRLVHSPHTLAVRAATSTLFASSARSWPSMDTRSANG